MIRKNSTAKTGFCGYAYPQVVKVSGSGTSTNICLFVNDVNEYTPYSSPIDPFMFKLAGISSGSGMAFDFEQSILGSTRPVSSFSSQTFTNYINLKIEGWKPVTGTYVAHIDFPETDKICAGSIYFVIEKT